MVRVVVAYDVLQEVATKTRAHQRRAHSDSQSWIHESEVAALYGYATVALWRSRIGRNNIQSAEAQQQAWLDVLREPEPPLDILADVRALDLAVDMTRLVTASRLWLSRNFQARHSARYDRRRRARRRRVACEWSSWKPESVMPDREVVLDDLHRALVGVLKPHQLAVVEAHFIEGRRIRDIARTLTETNPAYAGDLKRAERWVSMTVRRALERAREHLPPTWALNDA